MVPSPFLFQLYEPAKMKILSVPGRAHHLWNGRAAECIVLFFHRHFETGKGCDGRSVTKIPTPCVPSAGTLQARGLKMARKIAPGFAWAMVWLMALASTAAASGPAAVGSLVGSRNATLDGQGPLPHTVLLSGDKIAVNSGLAMVTLDRGNRVILGRDSEAVFLREADTLTVGMARGHLSLYHPRDGSRLRVKAGDVMVALAGGAGTLVELSLVRGLLVVTARDGRLKVEKDGATREVEKGHTLTVAATAGRAPAPAGAGVSSAPPGFSSETPVVAGAASGGAGAILASIALTRSSRQVSPVVPGP